MKTIIVALAVLTCNFCFAREQVINESMKSKYKFCNKEKLDQKIRSYSFFIEDSRIPNTDKIHYLIRLLRIYHFNGLQEKFEETLNLISALCFSYPECSDEFRRNYYFM